MTVYYYDLFTGASGGTAGTLLSSTTSDSGSTWPTNSSYNYGNAIELDGNGGIFSSVATAAMQIPSATQPSSYNFEVQYSLQRLSTSTTGTQSGVLLATASGFAFTDHWEFYYVEGSGFAFAHNDGPVGSFVAGPAVGTKWYIKIDVSTSGSNTTFTAYYSTTSGGSWTSLCTYTTTTPADLVTIGPFFNGGSAGTSTTGPHIGQLVVQDIPATTATLSGPVTGLVSSQSAPFTVTLNRPAGYGGVVVTPASTGTADTFQATSGGGNVTTIAIPAGSSTGTFYLTPSSTAGSRNVSITTSPTLSYPGSPISYDAMPTATAYTVSGASGGHQNTPVTWSITLTGGDFCGTITATPSGGVGQCQIFSPSIITFTGNGTLSKTFTFTPLDTDSVTYTFTNSGSMTNPSPVTFTSTGIY